MIHVTSCITEYANAAAEYTLDYLTFSFRKTTLNMLRQLSKNFDNIR